MTADALPLADLETYFADELGERVTDTEVLDGALNTMVAVSTESTEHAYVVRRASEMRDSDLFVGLDREYRVLSALADTDVPAPEPVAYCEDASVLGDPFAVTTYREGEPVPVGSPLPERFQTPANRRAVGEALVDTLADVHSVPTEPFEGVCERYEPLEQVERFADRLDRATDASGRDVPELRRAADWLREHAPPEHETRLTHGDFKSGNVCFGPGTPPEITGVLDWETATLAEPRTELGYLLFYWRDDGDPTPGLDAIRDRYGDDYPEAVAEVAEAAEHGFYRYANRPGSPSRRELVERYEAQTDLSFDHERFYRTHAALGLATVWEDIHARRVAAGEDSDWEPLLDYTAAVTRSIVDGEFAL
ncbi:Predicted kinase, aminoglycoside phosphotransferase (APT) family [Halobacterium jilantaiense]|uniref:Predicted kinase, aminoglycoside phosphotransferase (APT) family n=2 Tax=Halobacterium jilantaiense TaxID=355548 RepID=A0A1I0PY88_9EURY|nr:Predicted kinase, aminoglycoside phosphotransferase (APT) family [Halobacterium jilantaiense]